MKSIFSLPLKLIASAIGVVVAVLGFLFKPLGFVIYMVAAVWGLVLYIDIFYKFGGVIGVVVGFLFAPITGVIAPFYAIFKWGDWKPMVVVVGGVLVASALMYLSDRISDFFSTKKRSS